MAPHGFRPSCSASGPLCPLLPSVSPLLLSPLHLISPSFPSLSLTPLSFSPSLMSLKKKKAVALPRSLSFPPLSLLFTLVLSLPFHSFLFLFVSYCLSLSLLSLLPIVMTSHGHNQVLCALRCCYRSRQVYHRDEREKSACAACTTWQPYFTDTHTVTNKKHANSTQETLADTQTCMCM